MPGKRLNPKLLFTIMKKTFVLSVVLSLVASLQLGAQVLQEKRLTASFKKEPLSARLKSIQQQSGITIAFDEKDVAQKQAAATSFNNASLQEVLQQALKNLSLGYKEMDGTIVIVAHALVKSPARANGAMNGRIADEESGEPIAGATIRIGQISIASDVDGLFALSLPGGQYTAAVTSVGYGPRNITDIEVKAGEPFLLNLTLKREKGSLQQVTVTASAKKEGAAALFIRQKNNAAFTNGISADQIGRTPDKNVGETLKRISGVATMDNKYMVVRGLSERYNQAVLDGQVMPSTELNRKNFSFDIVPANLVENITVVKTLTPDKSAEFGGGLVEVNTKNIPEQNFLSLSAGSTWNDKTTGKTFYSLPLEGREYAAQVSKSRYLFGSLDWKSAKDVINRYEVLGKSPVAISNNWGITSFTAQPSQNYQLSLGRVLHTGRSGQKWGLVASASYRNTLQTQDVNTSREGWGNASNTGGLLDGAIAKSYGFTTNLSGLLGIGYHNKNTRISLQSLYLRNLDQQLVIILKGSNPAGYHWGATDITSHTVLWQNQLKGEQAIGHKGVVVNWMGSFVQLDRQRPDNHQVASDAIADSVQLSNVNIRNSGATATTSGSLRLWTRALEKNYTWGTSVSVPFRLPHTTGNSLKIGYAGWSKDRLFYVLNSYSHFNSREYFIPLTSAFTPEYQLNLDFDRRFNDNFHRKAGLHAVYAMLDNRLGSQWRLVWGLRAEYYDLNRINANLDSLAARFPGKDLSDLRNKEKNWNLFPSANLTFSLTPKMNLRLAYAKSIIRPDLRELTNFAQYDYELGGDYIGGLVHSTSIRHYDFRYEWYPSPGDILSLSLFYKKMDYPMAIYQVFGNPVYQLQNDKDAKNYGFEVEARKSFAFTKIPVLRNITLYGNLTYLDARVRQMSTTTIPDPQNPNKIIAVETVHPVERRPQTGASNYMYNAGFYFDTKPVSFSMTYNQVTNRLFRPSGPGHQNESLYEQPLKSLDAQLAVRFLHRKAELKLNVANLLNSFYVVYQNRYTDPDLSNSKKDPSKKELEYQAGKDMVDYKASPGRTYGATITYTFK
jgi:hypothetical protein